MRALLETESLNMAGTEEFVLFAKAGGNSFGFLLASRSYLYLCDQRSGVPLLKWQHDVEKPCFIDVYRLSDLRFQTMNQQLLRYSRVVLECRVPNVLLWTFCCQ